MTQIESAAPHEERYLDESESGPRRSPAPEAQISLVDAWRSPEARVFFRSVWPLYVHELSAFGTEFYSLDASGRWLPDLVEDWLSSATPPQNLRDERARRDPTQPYQRTHVIASDGRPVGFVCAGVQPFRYMPADADLHIAEFFLIHPSRGTGTADRAIELLLQRYPGRCHLRTLQGNTRALRFWRRALASLGVRDLEERRTSSDVEFRFLAAPEASRPR